MQKAAYVLVSIVGEGLVSSRLQKIQFILFLNQNI